MRAEVSHTKEPEALSGRRGGFAVEQYLLSEAVQAYRRVASGKSRKVVLIMTSVEDVVGQLAAAARNDNA